MSWGRRYVPVAERRAKAARKVAKMLKKGETPMPIHVDGRKIAKTFWGVAWCENLEAYSDYANRLPRGRTYARNGSIVDLRIEQGEIRALVAGSRMYRVVIKISPLGAARWESVREASRGKIASVVELLQGNLSDGVMTVVTDPQRGLFPSPSEIRMGCSCPDWATMCKHVAATLYGVGTRLDHEPKMLFTLRGVDPDELIQDAIASGISGVDDAPGRRLDTADLSGIFGVSIDFDDVAPPAVKKQTSAGRKRSKPPGPERDARETAEAEVSGSPQTMHASEQEEGWVLALIKEEPGVSRSDIGEILGLEHTAVQRILRRLRRKKRIVFQGGGRLGGYHLP